MSDGTDEDVQGTAEENLEILCGQRATHGEHDDTQDDARTTSLLHPGKQFGKQERDACCKNDKVGGVMG